MKKARYLVDHMFTAEAAAHVFNGRLYIYPSHDIESGIPENDNGDHFDMRFAEVPRDVVILDKEGKPLTAGDHDRRFFEASWMHKYNGKYYFSYSTGNTIATGIFRP